MQTGATGPIHHFSASNKTEIARFQETLTMAKVAALLPEELTALKGWIKAFPITRGPRSWQVRLCTAWQTGNYYGVSTDISSRLQGLRNRDSHMEPQTLPHSSGGSNKDILNRLHGLSASRTTSQSPYPKTPAISTNQAILNQMHSATSGWTPSVPTPPKVPTLSPIQTNKKVFWRRLVAFTAALLQTVVAYVRAEKNRWFVILLGLLVFFTIVKILK